MSWVGNKHQTGAEAPENASIKCGCSPQALFAILQWQPVVLAFPRTLNSKNILTIYLDCSRFIRTIDSSSSRKWWAHPFPQHVLRWCNISANAANGIFKRIQFKGSSKLTTVVCRTKLLNQSTVPAGIGASRLGTFGDLV